MSPFRSASVVARLTIAFGTTLALYVACASMAVWQQSQANDALQSFAHEDVQKIQALERWIALSDQMATQIMVVNKSNDAALSAAVSAGMPQLIKGLVAQFERVKANATSPREMEWVAGFPERREVLRRLQGEITALRKSGDSARAGSLFDAQYVPAQKVYNDYVQKLASIQQEKIDAKVAAYEAAGRMRILLIALSGGVLGLIAVALAWSVTRHIERSLKAAVDLSRAVSGGDLSMRVADPGNDEFGTLMRALSEMSESLEKIVTQVRIGTAGIATASTEIASGNGDLSQRTEQQAGNLQQVASTMEQITQSVRNNADNAAQANGLAHDASEVAQRGGEIVAKVVTTMTEIDAASRRIQEIIGVIDGISFQTNILALNAAVEAARAGEQGRGFAVVAGEVRSLAQRSAQAAKEIKSLIADSSNKVRNGGQQVEIAGRTMSEIVQSVRRVSELVSEISSATGQQTVGISEVGQSVNEIDRMTQQNAALVEEAAAASESLRTQAGILDQAVSVFRLSGQPA